MNHADGKDITIRLPGIGLPVSGLDIWWVPLPQIDYKTLLASYSDCLSTEEHERLQSRRLPKGQLQFVFTRVVLRHLLTAYHPEIARELWQVGRSESGRPHLLQEQTSLSFNLTHTDDCLVFAFSQYADPGVDVELLSRTIVFDEVAKRYFSMPEYNELQRLSEAERPEFFYRLWTLKEAAVKASGLGLAKGLHRFRFGQPGHEFFSHQIDDAGMEVLKGNFRFWSACFRGHVIAAALMSQPGIALPDIRPVSRSFTWPDGISTVKPHWVESQSRNSSTNLEP